VPFLFYQYWGRINFIDVHPSIFLPQPGYGITVPLSQLVATGEHTTRDAARSDSGPTRRFATAFFLRQGD
jgi:hypothetical protein